MSEVYFQLQARFPTDDLSARAFRGIYARRTPEKIEKVLAEFNALGIDALSFLSPDVLWELEDCLVDDENCLHLKALSGAGPSQGVIPALTLAMHQAGASSVLTVLYDTSSGTYQALSIDNNEVVEVYTTFDYDSVGDDYFEGIRRLLLRAYRATSHLVNDGLLDKGQTT